MIKQKTEAKSPKVKNPGVSQLGEDVMVEVKEVKVKPMRYVSVTDYIKKYGFGDKNELYTDCGWDMKFDYEGGDD